MLLTPACPGGQGTTAAISAEYVHPLLLLLHPPPSSPTTSLLLLSTSTPLALPLLPHDLTTNLFHGLKININT